MNLLFWIRLGVENPKISRVKIALILLSIGSKIKAGREVVVLTMKGGEEMAKSFLTFGKFNMEWSLIKECKLIQGYMT